MGLFNISEPYGAMTRSIAGTVQEVSSPGVLSGSGFRGSLA